MGCGASATPAQLAKQQGEEAIKRFEVAVEGKNILEVLDGVDGLRATDVCWNNELWSGCIESRKTGAALLMDAVLSGKHRDLGANQSIVDAAVFLDMDVMPDDTFDASQLDEDFIVELFEVQTLRNILAPDVCRRLETVIVPQLIALPSCIEEVPDELVMQTIRCTRLLSADEIKAIVPETRSTEAGPAGGAGTREKAGLCMMAAVLCRTAPEKDEYLVDAAFLFYPDVALYREKLNLQIRSRKKTNT